jgi:hypothetical protein
MSVFTVGQEFGAGAANRLLNHGYYQTSAMGEGEVRLKYSEGKYYHVIKISGVEYKVAEYLRADIMGMFQVVTSYSLANNSILTVTAIPRGTIGRVLIRNSTNNNGAEFVVGFDSVTSCDRAQGGGTVWSGTKDTASRINVYFGSSSLEIQNLLGTGLTKVIYVSGYFM